MFSLRQPSFIALAVSSIVLSACSAPQGTVVPSSPSAGAQQIKQRLPSPVVGMALEKSASPNYLAEHPLSIYCRR